MHFYMQISVNEFTIASEILCVRYLCIQQQAASRESRADIANYNFEHLCARVQRIHTGVRM